MPTVAVRSLSFDRLNTTRLLTARRISATYRRYMELKWEEVMRWETSPSPVEFDMYYSG